MSEELYVEIEIPEQESPDVHTEISEDEELFIKAVVLGLIPESAVDEKIQTHNQSQEAHPYIQQLVANEMSARQSADNSLAQSIREETERAGTAETNLNTAIEAEESERIEADNNLQGQINQKPSASDVASAISAHNTSDLSHEDIRAVADEALTRASDKAISKVFDTTAEMDTWLKDPTNKGVLKVGDNIYIIDPSVPDYWVSAVYETADPTTGYYYRINQLSSEVPDITNMVTTNTAQTITGNKNFTGALQKNGANVLVSTDIEEYTETEIEILWSSL